MLEKITCNLSPYEARAPVPADPCRRCPCRHVRLRPGGSCHQTPAAVALAGTYVSVRVGPAAILVAGITVAGTCKRDETVLRATGDQLASCTKLLACCNCDNI
jgi:hypothetical protein